MSKVAIIFLSIFAFSLPSWAIDDMPRGNVFFTDAAKDAIDDNFDEVGERIGAIAGGTDDQNAGEVVFTPAGDIASTNTQSALEELDAEKVSSTSLSAAIAADSTVASKADNTAVMHLTGNEYLTGIKEFGGTVTVPTPTNDTDAATKAYVDANAGTVTLATVLTGDEVDEAPTVAAVNNGLDTKVGSDELTEVGGTHVDTFYRSLTEAAARGAISAEEADATILKDADIGVTVLAPTGDGSGLTGITAGTDAVITGYVSGAGTVAATDTILEAIEKLDGNVGAVSAGAFTLDTFPVYEDSAHTTGFAVDATRLAVYSAAAGEWGVVALDFSTLSATPTAGTLSVSPTSWDPVDGDTDTAQVSQTFTYTAVGGTVNFSDAVNGLADNYFTDATTGTCTDSTVLTVGQSCTSNLLFSYTLAGTYGDTLVTTSDATDSPESVTLGDVVVSAVSSELTGIIGEDTTNEDDTNTTMADGTTFYTVVTATETGTAANMHFMVNFYTGDANAAIWDNSTGARLMDGTAVTGVSGANATMDVALDSAFNFVSGTTYRIGFVLDATDSVGKLYSDTANGSLTIYQATSTSGDTVGTLSGDTLLFSNRTLIVWADNTP